jgi:hypothetical protein
MPNAMIAKAAAPSVLPDIGDNRTVRCVGLGNTALTH